MCKRLVGPRLANNVTRPVVGKATFVNLIWLCPEHSGCPMRIEAGAIGLYPFWAGLYSKFEVKVIESSNTYKSPFYLLFSRGTSWLLLGQPL